MALYANYFRNCSTGSLAAIQPAGLRPGFAVHS